MISDYFTHPLTIITFPGPAAPPYNGDVDWSGAAENSVPGWFPQTQIEETDDGNRDATVTYRLVSWPAGTVVGSRDRVRDEAPDPPVTYKVYGEPNLCPTPTVASHHLEVKLQRVGG